MNAKYVLLVGAIVVLGGGGILAWGAFSPDAVVKDKEAMMEKTSDATMVKDTVASTSDTMMKKDEGSMMKSGSYEVYGVEKLAMASTDHDVVLFFRATWCPICRAIDADIRAHLKDIPSNLTILDVDYDHSASLKQKYGVTYQHTFVQVDAQGTLIKKWSGSPTLSALVAEIK